MAGLSPVPVPLLPSNPNSPKNPNQPSSSNTPANPNVLPPNPNQHKTPYPNQLSFAAVVSSKNPSAPEAFSTSKSLLPEIAIANRPPSSVNGEPAFLISPVELSKANASFATTLVAKFSGGRPPLANIRRQVNTTWGLDKPATVGLLDARHVMIHLQSSSDLVKAWTRGNHLIDNPLFRLFRWTPAFNQKWESYFAPVWIRLPYLPLPYFHAPILKGVVNSFARFLRTDERTLTPEHPMYARVCVEIDLSKPLPPRVWVGTSKENGFWQKVVYEGNVAYCSH